MNNKLFELIGVDYCGFSTPQILTIKNYGSGEVASISASKAMQMTIDYGECIDGLCIDGCRLKFDDKKIKSSENTTNKVIDNKVESYTVYSGERLANLIHTRLNKKFSERYFVKDILKFCKSDIVDKVLIIHGVRRTGKTTSIMQTIDTLINNGIDADSIVYITLNSKDAKTGDIIKHLDNNIYKYKYAFIDEITLADDFDDRANAFSDSLSAFMKIILTGTDSYAFVIAAQQTLFDRFIALKSTIIDFKEQVCLLDSGNIDKNELVESYRVGGGTLVDDEFDTKRHAYRALKAITVSNIKNSIRNIDKEQAALKDLKDIDMMYLIVHYIYNAIRVRSDSEIHNDKEKLREEMVDVLSQFSGIPENFWKDIDVFSIGKRYGVYILEALLDLDIVYPLKNMAIPSDKIKTLRYTEYVCLIQGLVNSIYNSMSNNKDDIIGNTLENMILANLVMWAYKRRDAEVGYARYTADDGKDIEVDAVVKIERIINGKTYSITNLIEVKNSSTDKNRKKLAKNLIKRSINEAIPGLNRKIVVYLGETTIDYIDKENDAKIYYTNVYDFLMDLDKWLI